MCARISRTARAALSVLRTAMTTCAPLSASTLVVCSPRPPFAPVMTAVRPVRIRHRVPRIRHCVSSRHTRLPPAQTQTGPPKAPSPDGKPASSRTGARAAASMVGMSRPGPIIPVRPARWPRFSSPLRSTALTARLGRLVGICFGVCFVTGMLSHYQYQPWSWLPEPASPVWLYRVTQGISRRDGNRDHPAAAGQAVVGLPEPVPLAAGSVASSTLPSGCRCSSWSRQRSSSCPPASSTP